MSKLDRGEAIFRLDTMLDPSIPAAGIIVGQLNFVLENLIGSCIIPLFNRHGYARTPKTGWYGKRKCAGAPVLFGKKSDGSRGFCIAFGPAGRNCQHRTAATCSRPDFA